MNLEEYMRLDLRTCDPNTLPAGPELDAVVAEWMVWEWQEPIDNWPGGWLTPQGFRSYWRPSTNPAHAGEARRSSAYGSVVEHLGGLNQCVVWVDDFRRTVFYSETDGDKGKAEALAISRAIAVAMKAKAGGGE